MVRVAFCALAFMFILAPSSLIADGREQPDYPEYTKAQIKELTRGANSFDEYSELADYYARQQNIYQTKAVEMMHLWSQRNEMYYRVEKWPRPVDSARNLHDYYEYRANEAAKLESQFRRKADQARRMPEPSHIY